MTPDLTPAQLAAGIAAAFAVKEDTRQPSFTRDPTPYVQAIGRAVLGATPTSFAGITVVEDPTLAPGTAKLKSGDNEVEIRGVPIYSVHKESGSRWAYVVNDMTSVRVRRYDVLKLDGYNNAKKHCDRLNGSHKGKS